ncbi:MAG: tRNA pseudouridine(55) synthase TruB [Coriobacteriales bacterium]|jgi:tRNA pseudouridine55 synthase|nr:tRNA pseudouridine(55) synthase TruB [Coriobacteriales bacterium]
MVKAKRGATGLSGVIAVDKPAGMTSHDVVDRLRRITGEGRIGHAGTLDPAATGLLLVCIGPATRLSSALMEGEKVYEAHIAFGSATSTDDAEGEVVATAALPEGLADEGFARSVLAGFEGEQDQMPPRFSAIKKNGRKAYELARAGRPVELEPRRVVVHRLRLVGAGAAHWDIEARVSKGTYIRALARDLGEAVGSRAHLGALRRTRVGAVSVARAHTLEELAHRADGAAQADAPGGARADVSDGPDAPCGARAAREQAIRACFLDPASLPPLPCHAVPTAPEGDEEDERAR